MIQILDIISKNGKSEYLVDYDENGKRHRDSIVFSKFVTASGVVLETIGSEDFAFNEYIGSHPELKQALFSALRMETNGTAIEFPIKVNGNGKA